MIRPLPAFAAVGLAAWLVLAVRSPTEADERGTVEQLATELHTLTSAFTDCASDHEPFTEAFAGCVCDRACAHVFAVEGLAEGSGVVVVQVPFVDVDGLELSLQPDGRATSCAYRVGSEVLAERACAAP